MMAIPARDEGPPPRAAADPDTRARTHLANERTFLAWLRSGLSLVAVGVGVAGFLPLDLVPDLPYVTIFATALAAAGTGVVFFGGVRYRSARREIDGGNYVPTATAIVVITIIVGVLGILSIPIVFLLR